MKKHTWSDEDRLKLSVMCQWHTIPELAEMLGVSTCAVRNQLTHLKINLTKKRGYKCAPLRTWTEEEVAFLKTRAGRMSSPNIAKRLGKSERSVRLKATRMGLSLKKNLWTDEKIELLEKLVGEGERWGVIADQVGKSVGACQSKAKYLMLERGERYRWSEEDMNLLLEMRSEGKTFREISIKLGRTRSACQKKYERDLKS
jgi:biotin operon repressor